MNDLSKKEEMHLEENKPQESASLSKGVSSSGQLLRKKIKNYLLLLYQGYLKGETNIAPEMRSAFLSLVKQDKDFAFKARMMQLDYLKLENVELEGEWNETKEVLFPIIEATSNAVEEHRKVILAEYKEIILELLKSSSELRS